MALIFIILVLISLDGIFNFILYNNVIYIIYHNVIFKWKWCESVILLDKSEKSSSGKFMPQNNTKTTAFFVWLPEFSVILISITKNSFATNQCSQHQVTAFFSDKITKNTRKIYKVFSCPPYWLSSNICYAETRPIRLRSRKN